MSTQQKPFNEPAFPEAVACDALGGVNYSRQSGMTLRDYFAAKAMAAAMMSECNPNLAAARLAAAKRHGRRYEAHLAVEAYEIADAMLTERAR